jgi:hypothetical protein
MIAEDRIQIEALRGRIVEIGLTLRKDPKAAIRRALERERFLICGALKNRRKQEERGP